VEPRAGECPYTTHVHFCNNKNDEGFETRRHEVIVSFEKLLETVLPLISVTFDRDCLEWSDSSGATDSGFKLSLHAVTLTPPLGLSTTVPTKTDATCGKV